MNDFFAGIAIGAISVFLLGVIFLPGTLAAKATIARGEIACEYIHDTLVCWNPKESKKGEQKGEGSG